MIYLGVRCETSASISAGWSDRVSAAEVDVPDVLERSSVDLSFQFADRSSCAMGFLSG